MANHTNWLNISSTRGSSGQTRLTITASTNHTNVDKLAIIKAYDPEDPTVSSSTYVRLDAYSPFLYLDKTIIGSPATGGTYEFSISSNTSYVIAYPDMVSSYSTSAASGNASITFTIRSTSLTTTVVGNIVITDITGQYSRTLRIEQYGGGAHISFSPTAVTIPYYGGSEAFTVTADCIYSVEKGTGDWYSLSSESGYTGSTQFSINANLTNSGNTDWADTITIVGPEGVAGMVQVTQLNWGQYHFDYTADTSNISYTGERRSITIDTTDAINSSITVTIVGAPDVTYTYEASGLTRGIVTIDVPQNPTDYARQFKVIVTGRRALSQNNSTAVIEYTQEPLQLDFVTDTSNVKGIGEIRTITLLNDNLNPNRTGLNLPSDFPQRGSYTVDGNVIYLTYPTNPSSSVARTWTITIYAQTRNGTNLSGSYSITQNANAIYSIPYTADTSDVSEFGETRTVTIDTSNLIESSITIGLDGATGVTYTYDNGIISITFPENTGFDQYIDLNITGETLDRNAAYADITYVQNGQYIIPTGDTRLIVIYNSESTTEETPILTITGSSNSFTKAELNGMYEITMNSGYTFPRTGKQAIFYTLKNDILGRGGGINPGDFTNVGSVVFVVIPSGVTTINENCFARCNNLTSVTIPDSVTIMNRNCFGGCRSLKKCILPNNLSVLGDSCFQNCNSLTEIVIPDSVTSTIPYCFSGCTSLTSATIGTGITNFGGGCDWILPDSTGTTALGGGTFIGCTSLKQIAIPDNVTEISNKSFLGCSSLSAVSIGTGVTMIGDKAFYNCTSLLQIIIPDTVRSVANNAFCNCSGLTSVTVSNNIYSLGGDNPYTGSTQPTGCFDSCTSLSSITIPQGVSLGDYCFNGCSSLTSITIHSGSELGSCVFKNDTGLITANIDTALPDGTFKNCVSLSSMTLGDNCDRIGDDAFYHCSSLLSIVIPRGEVGFNSSSDTTNHTVFNDCRSLSAITIGSGVTRISTVTFSGVKLRRSNFVNYSSLDPGTRYWGAKVYDTIVNGLYISDNTTVIGCVEGLQRVEIPNAISTLDEYCFSGVTSITSATIPDSVTSAGSSCFYGCSNLQTVQIGNGLTSLPSSMFNWCSSLTSLTIPDSVQTIGTNVCSNCNSLSSITIGSGVTTFAYGSFENNSNLNTVRFTSLAAPTYRDYVFSRSSSTGTMYYPLNATGYNNWVRYFTNIGWTVVQV